MVESYSVIEQVLGGAHLCTVDSLAIYSIATAQIKREAICDQYGHLMAWFGEELREL